MSQLDCKVLTKGYLNQFFCSKTLRIVGLLLKMKTLYTYHTINSPHIPKKIKIFITFNQTFLLILLETSKTLNYIHLKLFIRNTKHIC